MAIPARRRIADILALLFATLATLFGLVWLTWILWTTLVEGGKALTPALFTQMTPPPGASGGLLNAFYGSAVMISDRLADRRPDRRCCRDVSRRAGALLAACRGRQLHQRHPTERSVDRNRPVRLSACCPANRSLLGFAGALALAMILVPVVVRTTDEALRLVPNQMREAASRSVCRGGRLPGKFCIRPR